MKPGTIAAAPATFAPTPQPSVSPAPTARPTQQPSPLPSPPPSPRPSPKPTPLLLQPVRVDLVLRAAAAASEERTAALRGSVAAELDLDEDGGGLVGFAVVG